MDSPKPSGANIDLETANKVQQRYYWPGWLDEVRRHMNQYEKCSRRKGPKQLPIAPLTSIPVGKPFYMIAVDICGPFTVTHRGNKYILMAAGYFSKWPECWVIPDQEAKTIARWVEELISCHGSPLDRPRGKF